MIQCTDFETLTNMPLGRSIGAREETVLSHLAQVGIGLAKDRGPRRAEIDRLDRKRADDRLLLDLDIVFLHPSSNQDLDSKNKDVWSFTLARALHNLASHSSNTSKNSAA